MIENFYNGNRKSCDVQFIMNSDTYYDSINLKLIIILLVVSKSLIIQLFNIQLTTLTHIVLQ